LIRLPEVFQHVSKMYSAAPGPFSFRSYFYSAFSHAAHILNLKKVALLVAGVFVVFLAGRFFWPEKFSIPSSGEVPGSEMVLAPLCEGCISFGSDDISSFVAHDIDIYLESGNLKGFFPLISLLEPRFKNVSGPFEKDVLRHFAFFGNVSGTPSWTLLVFWDDETSVELLGAFDGVEGLHVGKSGGVYFVSTDPGAARGIEEAHAEISKNLSLNPRYVLNMAAAKKSGKAVVMTFSDNGKKFLSSQSLEGITLTEEIRSFLTDFFAREDTYLIL
jgi:hypothetical protein